MATTYVVEKKGGQSYGEGQWLHRVAVTNLPEDYETRLTEMVPGQFKNLKLLGPDPYDCILSKLEREGTTWTKNSCTSIVLRIDKQSKRRACGFQKCRCSGGKDNR